MSMRKRGTKCPHDRIQYCPLYVGMHIAGGPSCWPKDNKPEENGRSYTWHTYAPNIAGVLCGNAESARDSARNEIDILIGKKPIPRPNNGGSRRGPDRSQVRRIGILESETLIRNDGGGDVDQQSSDSDSSGLQIDNIGSFQVDWRTIKASAEMIDAGQPFDALATGYPYPPSPLWRGEVPHE